MRIVNYIIVITFLLLFGCANQTAPTGGPKDSDPPVLLRSTPENRQINIKPKEISLEFDELVKLKNAKEQVLITPRVTQEYNITSKRNRVYIKFEEPLNDSTTYTLNFREGIQDLTEGNTPKDLQLAFSTGPYLDSLSIHGNVKTRLNNKPAKDISILLYDANDTLNLLNGPPIYLTKTSDKGHYDLTNIKSGTYNLFALNDKNKNLMADVKSEVYGFYLTPITLDSAITDINLDMQYLDVSPLVKISARQSGTTFEAKYNKHITNYTISNDDSLTLYSNFVDETHKSIQIFNPQNIQDSLKIYVSVTDSINNNLIDTVYLKFEPTKRSPQDFNMTVQLDKIFITDGLLTGNVTFNKPITHINYDSIYVYLDSLNIFHLDSNQIVWNNHHNNFTIQHTIDPMLLQPTSTPSSTANPPNLVKNKSENEQQQTSKPDKDPQLYFGGHAFISAEYDSSQIKTSKLAFTKPDLFGIILVEITTDQKSYFVQLLDSKDKVIQTINSQQKFSFKKVSPGDYRIRILIDNNNDGVWNPGNILTNTPAEDVVFYKSIDGNEVLTIRANWELGPNLIEF